MKIRPLGAEFSYDDRRMDGQTDMMKLSVAFRNLVNAPQMTLREKL